MLKIDSECEALETIDAPKIDFGVVFADGDAVCDYSPSIEEIGAFMSTVVSLLGHSLSPDELKRCEGELRSQYIKHRPFGADPDKDVHTYHTPWTLPDGTPICIRVVLRKLNSIKVPSANKKMVEFTVCDPSGHLIGTLRNLPWRVENMREVAHAIRSLLQRRFPRDLLGKRIADEWLSAGGRDDLPQTVNLGVLPDGSELGIRFDEVATEIGKDDDRRVASASILLDGCPQKLQELQPPMFRKICPKALDEESFYSFIDMQDSVVGEDSDKEYASWLFKLQQRYDYLYNFQQGDSAGIVTATLQGGEQVEIFSTGEYSLGDKAIYGLCRSRCEGRWTNVVWAFAEQLRGIGIVRLPEKPDFRAEWYTFDPNVKVGNLSRHVLDHAHRWCSNSIALTGKKDALGHDIFVDDGSREEMYTVACEELGRSLRYAAENPAAVGYGYYHAAVDRAKGNYSPIALFLPACFSDQAKSSGKPDAFFALRVLKGGESGRCIRYDVPTILPPSYVKRTMSVLGEATMRGLDFLPFIAVAA